MEKSNYMLELSDAAFELDCAIQVVNVIQRGIVELWAEKENMFTNALYASYLQLTSIHEKINSIIEESLTEQRKQESIKC